MEFIQDIVVGVLILLGIIIGLFNGFFRKINRLVIFSILFVIVYFAFLPMLSKWVQYNCLADFNYVITLNISEEMTFEVYSINDLFLAFQNFNIAPDFLASNCTGVCNAVSFFALLIVTLLLSTPISWILYDLVFKKMLSLKLRKPKALSRIGGGIFGGLQWFVLAILFFVSVGSITGGVNSYIVPGLADPSSEVSIFFNNANINSIGEIVKYAYILDPMANSSHILRPVLNLCSSINFDIFSMFKGSIIVEEGGKEIVQSSNLYQGFESLLKQLVTKVDFSS